MKNSVKIICYYSVFIPLILSTLIVGVMVKGKTNSFLICKKLGFSKNLKIENLYKKPRVSAIKLALKRFKC